MVIMSRLEDLHDVQTKERHVMLGEQLIENTPDMECRQMCTLIVLKERLDLCELKNQGRESLIEFAKVYQMMEDMGLEGEIKCAQSTRSIL